MPKKVKSVKRVRRVRTKKYTKEQAQCVLSEMSKSKVVSYKGAKKKLAAADRKCKPIVKRKKK